MFNTEMKVAILNKLTDLSELSESQQKDLENTYSNVSTLLNQNLTIINYGFEFFPQGSIAIGTTVKPNEKDDYDIDEVCEFRPSAYNLSPQKNKRNGGRRTKK